MTDDADRLLRTGHCTSCGNKRVRRTAHGWTPCGCLSRLQQRDRAIQIAPPLLRGNDPFLPEVWIEREPWPAGSDHFVRGDEWDTFRYMAWRSLLAIHEARQATTHSRPPFRVEVMPTWRLQEISFQRDPEERYTSLLQLQRRPELLILIEGVEPFRQQTYIRDLAESVLHARHLHQAPTWVYTPQHLHPISATTRTALTHLTPEERDAMRRDPVTPQPPDAPRTGADSPTTIVKTDGTGKVKLVH